MSTAIKVENLSKAYQLGEIGTGTLANDLKRWAYKVSGKEDPFLKIGETNDRTTKGESDMVWSLKDINFEIEQGDAVGIIGRNGAGKSTLLKILSRVTSPTTGSVRVKGRVASLLEVGTGFHPELTGRENIFLNGSILGMRKAEIKKHFDAIVDFAGVERYIDTPVKRYSSGMYVRLAFGVAAHLDSEILIVDEVLAVGDFEFQKKCLGKMNDVSKGEGRTVLFVSHDMAAINQLCSESILLKNGSIHKIGQTDVIISDYLRIDNQTTKNELFFDDDKSLKNQFLYVSMCDLEDLERKAYKFDEEVVIKVNLKVDRNNKNIELGMRLVDNLNRAIFTINEFIPNYYNQIENIIMFKITIPANFLTPGSFSWIMAIHEPNVNICDLKLNILNFSIAETGSEFSKYQGFSYGCVFSKHTIQKLN